MSTASPQDADPPDAIPQDANELIEDGQGLVRSIALKVHRGLPIPMDLDDLIAYGQLGLAEAAQVFSPDSGVKFTTFAYHRVRGSIYDGIAKMTWTSRARLRRIRFQEMAGSVLENEQNDAPENTPGHPPAHAGASDSPSQWPDAARRDADWLGRVTERLAVVYLATSSEESADDSITNAASRDESPSRVVASRELQQTLRKLVTQMPRESRRLIEGIYFEGYTLTQAADRMGISKSWASRLHAKSLDDLARILRSMDSE